MVDGRWVPAVLRITTTTLVLALCLAGCGTSKGEQVALVTQGGGGNGCVLLYEVVDVIADPTYGTVVKEGGWPLRWPTGYTAWRVGTEVQVLDRSGNVILTTGGRYRIGPVDDGTYSTPQKEWVVGCIGPCPGCELGSGVA
jgi:hypothetical protein